MWEFKVLTMLDSGLFLSSLLPCYSSCIENPKCKSQGNRACWIIEATCKIMILFASCGFTHVVVLIHPLVSRYMPEKPLHVAGQDDFCCCNN